MNTRPIKVLIADDDKLTRHLLRTLLRQYGVDIVGEANDGQETLAKYAKLSPDILFLDINMPVTNGFEALHWLRQSAPDLAVIMISSDATEKNVTKAALAQVDGFVVKPFSPARVMEAITRCVQKRAGV